MIYTEWNWDDAKEVWQEEAREEGREEGREQGIDKALELIAQGYTVEEARHRLTKTS